MSDTSYFFVSEQYPQALIESTQGGQKLCKIPANLFKNRFVEAKNVEVNEVSEVLVPGGQSRCMFTSWGYLINTRIG